MTFEDMTNFLAAAVEKLFQNDPAFDPLRENFSVILKDLDGKDLSAWRDYMKACSVAKVKAADLANAIKFASAQRESFWRGLMLKYKAVSAASEAGRPMTMCKDADGQIAVSAGPVQKEKKDSDE
jgi:hypothetical protein